ncbi:MAG: IclR family transcriptional regulator [Acidimicrobiales bacterium]
MERTVSGIGVLDKSVAILDALARSDGSATLADLVAQTGLPKATAHRLTAGLEAHGLVRRDSRGHLLLGPRLVDLARAASPNGPLAEAARPALEALRAATGESAQLYVRDGEQRVCVLSLESSHELRTTVAEGARLPLGRGSAGRILDPAGRSGATVAAERPGAPDPGPGWMASVEERAAGVASVSAPVRDRRGAVIAAVGISGPVGRLGTDPGRRHGPAVVAAADRVSADLT